MRQQLPAFSPVTPGALVAGIVAAVRGGDTVELERRVAGLFEARYAAKSVLFTDSGTSALALAIAGAVEDAGGPVALPAYSCYDLATAVLAARVKAILYDLVPSTLSPDPESLHALGSASPSAVVYAPLYGYAWPLPQDALGGDVLTIVDAAQGVGAEVGGRPLGSLGSVSVLSFGRGKGMTGGGGGALLAFDDRGLGIVERARERLVGRPRRGFGRLAALGAQMALGRPSLFALPSALPFLRLGETVYHPPWSPERCAAASLAVLERAIPFADRESEVRRRNAERLTAAAMRAERLDLVETSRGSRPGFLRLPVLVRGRSGSSVVTKGARRLGIAGGYPTTLADVQALSSSLAPPARASLSGAAELARRLFTLPTHGLLGESDLRALEHWLSP